ncbi:MAG: hypothetical protein CL613_06585 [Aquimarina sp.]|nr:hypothetical protein [Aquimarina sp.]
MSQRNFKEDEVYLSQIFSPIGSFFKSLLQSFFLMIQFIVKRIFLFTGILIVGLILGYFLDQYYEKYTYKQEVIIQPRSNSTLYIYNFFNDFYKRLGDEAYLTSLGLKPEWGENIKSIEIKPIVAIEDVFDHLHNKYQDNGFLYTIQDYSEKELSNHKFIPFYKFHMITFEFTESNEANTQITKALLDHIFANNHFSAKIKNIIETAKSEVASYKKSLKFVDEYLETLNKSEKQENNNVVIVTEESESPTISGLLKQKIEILELLAENREKIELENEVFSIVENTGVVKVKKKLYKKMLFIIPLALVLLTSILYIFLYLYRKTIISEKQLS